MGNCVDKVKYHCSRQYSGSSGIKNCVVIVTNR